MIFNWSEESFLSAALKYLPCFCSYVEHQNTILSYEDIGFIIKKKKNTEPLCPVQLNGNSDL